MKRKLSIEVEMGKGSWERRKKKFNAEDATRAKIGRCVND